VQGDDASAVETRVIQLLGLDHFDLAKDLLRNRLKIVWVSKLRQAQDETEVSGVTAPECKCMSPVEHHLHHIQASAVRWGA
jgi:hypothetical protein